MTLVAGGEMRDKESQQRRRRANGAVRSVADRSAVEENRALAPQATQAPQGWPPVDRGPSCAGRDSVDSAQGGSRKFPCTSTTKQPAATGSTCAMIAPAR